MKGLVQKSKPADADLIWSDGGRRRCTMIVDCHHQPDVPVDNSHDVVWMLLISSLSVYVFVVVNPFGTIWEPFWNQFSFILNTILSPKPSFVKFKGRVL